ncbi:YkgJ family cysteine cluster protein [Cytophagales bacterium LB-30]|uniref:YkgJ family cysteine cluster protein n=1 Tax=Shiella aurantiaca TaxID=3058365 RepID=A0ABT8F4I5_9BACT|nr:YkgJ family cysteine cluster protein [Shiella aurantiaca]MDN4165367.1 YkgJ family cysteine cluster protein [Shiella aurantiaca]
MEKVFLELEQEITQFQQDSGLHCLKGCGECCKKPDIEATIIEFLPFAYHLFKEGKVDAFMEKLEANPSDSICLNFQPFITSEMQGGCTSYRDRGLICRVFGFSASTDKNGLPQLATCKLIKTNQQEAYLRAVESIKSGAPVPIIKNFYMKLYAIDYHLSEKMYPINMAMYKAIEYVSFHFSYRGKRAS